jgi:hypothetical protein
MDPVYTLVKPGSTTYCVLFLGQAQDMGGSPDWPDLLLVDLFWMSYQLSAVSCQRVIDSWQLIAGS